MDASTLYPVSHFGHSTKYENTVENPDSAALMNLIIHYLRETPSKSSLLTPANGKIQTWAASLPDYQVSPVVAEIHKYMEHGDSSMHSSSSPIESLFRNSSSLHDLGGPKTPPLTTTIHGTAPRSTRDDELMFSEMPKLPAPEPQVNINRNCSLRRSSEVVRSPSRATSISRRVSFGLPSPSSPAVERPPVPMISPVHRRMQATITNLVCLPEFLPSPPRTPIGRKPSVPPQLGISTESSADALLPSPFQSEWELSFPRTRPTFAEREAQKYRDQVRHPALIPDHSKELLKALEEKKMSPRMLPGQQPMTVLSASSPPSRLETINRLKASRQPMQIQIPTQIQRHSIQEVLVPNRTQRISEMDQEFLRSFEGAIRSIQLPAARLTLCNPLEMPVNNVLRKPVVAEPVAATRMQKKADIETVPVQSVKAIEGPTSSINSGVWFTKGFFAGREGMQIKMTRRVTTFSTTQWIIESDTGSKILTTFGHSNSSSRKTDFSDSDDTLIFTFQKRTGSTRVAEAPNGMSLFTIRNTLYSRPYWTVNLGADNATTGTAQWTARGDASLETVVMSRAGFQVGGISLASKAKKHAYVLNVAPKVNYCIVAALAMVFDDLRTDEGC